MCLQVYMMTSDCCEPVSHTCNSLRHTPATVCLTTWSLHGQSSFCSILKTFNFQQFFSHIMFLKIYVCLTSRHCSGPQQHMLFKSLQYIPPPHLKLRANRRTEISTNYYIVKTVCGTPAGSALTTAIKTTNN